MFSVRWHYCTFKRLYAELSAVGGDITRGKSRYGNSGVFVNTPAVAGGGVALSRLVERSSALTDWNEDVTFGVGAVQLHSSWSRLGASTPHRNARSCRCNHKQRSYTARLLPRDAYAQHRLCRGEMSVRPSHAGILSKRSYISSKFFHHRVALPF